MSNTWLAKAWHGSACWPSEFNPSWTPSIHLVNDRGTGLYAGELHTYNISADQLNNKLSRFEDHSVVPLGKTVLQILHPKECIPVRITLCISPLQTVLSRRPCFCRCNTYHTRRRYRSTYADPSTCIHIKRALRGILAVCPAAVAGCNSKRQR